MVRYSRNAEKFGVYLKEITKYVCKIYAIFAAVGLAVAVYGFVFGCITKEYEAFTLGGSGAVVTIICAVIISEKYLRIKNRLKQSFKNADSQGNLNFSLKFVDETLLITCLNTGEVNKINKRDIKKVSYANNTIFIRAGVTGLVTLSNDKKVRDFLETNAMLPDKK